MGPGRQLCSPAFGCLCPRDETDLGLLSLPSRDVGPQPYSLLSSDLCHSAAAARNKTPHIHSLCRLGPSSSVFMGSLFADGDPEVCAWSPRHPAPVPSCYSPCSPPKTKIKSWGCWLPCGAFSFTGTAPAHRDHRVTGTCPLYGCIEWGTWSKQHLLLQQVHSSWAQQPHFSARASHCQGLLCSLDLFSGEGLEIRDSVKQLHPITAETDLEAECRPGWEGRFTWVHLFCQLPRSQSEVLGTPMIAEFQGTEERGHAEKSSSQEHRDHPVQDHPTGSSVQMLKLRCNQRQVVLETWMEVLPGAGTGRHFCLITESSSK